MQADRRRFAKALATLPVAIPLAASLAPSAILATDSENRPSTAGGPESGVQRLNWAGIRFAAGNRNLYIDPIVTDIWGGDSPYPLVEFAPSESRNYALITHLHGDHFDAPGLKTLLGERGRVLCDESMASYIASRGLSVIPLQQWQPSFRGRWTVVPLPAVDGLGDTQLSWVVSIGGRKYLHAGDTMWHGQWRAWGEAYGPFDTVFLPMNGAIQQADPPTEIPLSMTPQQAVDATIQLGAKRMVPIHYGFHVDGSYEEYPDALDTLNREAERRQVRVEVIKPGDWLTS